MKIKFLQLNIQLDKHLDVIIPFIKENNFDVINLQEVLEPGFPKIKESLGMNGVFVKMDKNKNKFGTAIFSKHPIINHDIDYYWKGIDITEEEVGKNMYYQKRSDLSVLHATIDINGINFDSINIHFPPNYPGSEISDFQFKLYEDLKKILKTKDQFIMSGDFNTPRGYAIFDDLASLYKDHIPKDIYSTLDPELHRAKDLKLQFVVDAIFSTENYKVSNVQMHNGLSDHMAVTAEVEILEKL